MDSLTPHTTRAQVEAEWADLRPSLDRVVLQARSLIASLRDIPRPLYADERKRADAAVESFAELVANDLSDFLDKRTGPVRARADDAGMDPDRLEIDQGEIESERAALARETRPTVKERA